MQDETTVVPEEDNTTTPAQEEKEELTSPSNEDNGGFTPEMVEAMQAKVTDQSQKLRASKEEALRLKQELETLRSQPQDDALPVNEADVAALKALARAAGIPTREEMDALKQSHYRDIQEEGLNRFLSEHPEYKADQNWELIKGELEHYKTPTDPKEWYGLLNRAHKIIATDGSFEKGQAMGMAKAKLQEQAQIGGGASGGSSTPKVKKTPDQQSVSEGFKAVRPQYY